MFHSETNLWDAGQWGVCWVLIGFICIDYSRRCRSCWCDPHLSVSKVVEDGGQFLGNRVLVLARGSWVGVPPVNRQSVEPHVGLLHVRLRQARLEAVHLAAGRRQVALQGAVANAQPAAR